VSIDNIDDTASRGKGCAQDSVVLLRCAPNLVLAKRFHAGTWTPYDRCKTYDVATAPISGLRDLHRILAQATTEPRLCVVRGSMVAGDKATGIRRRSVPDPMTGDPPTLRDVPRSWVALDLDKQPVPDDVDLHDLVACAEAVMPRLPAAFQPATCIVQATASHTFKPGVNLRLWFWLDRPLTGAELKRWFRKAWRGKVDDSIFSPAQVIYTATPIFVDRADPLPTRLARRHGEPWVVTPTADELKPPDPAAVVCSGYSKLDNRRRAGIIRSILEAENGERNRRLHWGAARFGEAITHGELDDTLAYNLLIELARRIDLDEAEILPTIRSGLARGKAGDNFSAFDFEVK
jgi:hypothetical protein